MRNTNIKVYPPPEPGGVGGGVPKARLSQSSKRDKAAAAACGLREDW